MLRALLVALALASVAGGQPDDTRERLITVEQQIPPIERRVTSNEGELEISREWAAEVTAQLARIETKLEADQTSRENRRAIYTHIALALFGAVLALAGRWVWRRINAGKE